MDVLDLAAQYTPLKKAAAGEYHGPCPACGGADRFRVWTDQGHRGRYWCRSCDIKGDDVQFCRDVLGMDFPDACRATGNHHLIKEPASPPTLKRRPPMAPVEAPGQAEGGPDPRQWSEQAAKVARWCHRVLMKSPGLLAWLERERGITAVTAEAWQLGFCPERQESDPQKWGFAAGAPPVRVSRGLVIPHTQPNGQITGLKIRVFSASDNVFPDAPQEPNPRYIGVRGGGKCAWVLQPTPEPVTGPVVLVESELDALLLAQELDLMINPVALLTASRRPDRATLPPGPLLFSLDFDDAGRKAFAWWKNQHQAAAAPPATGKDITDMHRAGIDAQAWLKKCLAHAGLLSPEHLNPYAHFTLLAGRDWQHRGDVPDHLWSTLGDIVTRWQMTCDDPASRRQIEREYRGAWGHV